MNHTPAWGEGKEGVAFFMAQPSFCDIAVRNYGAEQKQNYTGRCFLVHGSEIAMRQHAAVWRVLSNTAV